MSSDDQNSRRLTKEEVRMVCNHVLAIIAKSYPNSTHTLIEENVNCARHKIDTGTGKQFDVFIKARLKPSKDVRDDWENHDWDFRNLEYVDNRHYIFACSTKDEIDEDSLEICAMTSQNVYSLFNHIREGESFKIEVSRNNRSQQFKVSTIGKIKNSLLIDIDAINKI